MATVGPTRDGQELYPRPWLLRDWLCWGCAGEVEAVYLERDESFHCTRGPKAQLSGTTPAPPLTGARGTLLWLLFCRRLEKHCRGGGSWTGREGGVTWQSVPFSLPPIPRRSAGHTTLPEAPCDTAANRPGQAAWQGGGGALGPGSLNQLRWTIQA